MTRRQAKHATNALMVKLYEHEYIQYIQAILTDQVIDKAEPPVLWFVAQSRVDVGPASVKVTLSFFNFALVASRVQRLLPSAPRICSSKYNSFKCGCFIIRLVSSSILGFCFFVLCIFHHFLSDLFILPSGSHNLPFMLLPFQ